jgi:hypothetical protein
LQLASFAPTNQNGGRRNPSLGTILPVACEAGRSSLRGNISGKKSLTESLESMTLNFRATLLEGECDVDYSTTCFIPH